MSGNPVCNVKADYSAATGERILPFVFSLNMEESVLYPGEGEYQTFCYDITANGEDTKQYADLSHFLLGICQTITPEDIITITVVINGEEQEVLWGENVEIKTRENPDNPTGCTGLKFDFPLDKQIGFMQICIVMSTPYRIGPVNVCLYGEDVIATGLQICGPDCNGNTPCESVFYQKETVCVPVKVTPYAKAGIAKASCCGNPIVRAGVQCTGSQTSCTFTITQDLCIEVPVSFGAEIETGTATVQCGSVGEEECDCSQN